MKNSLFMDEEAIVVNKGDNNDNDQVLLDLPPGFRFHPTDEELITSYLTEKVLNCSFTAAAIGEADLNKCEPWDLPKKAKMGEKEWYFFCQRDRKYPTGMRTNRATESGYWKATGKDKEIFKGKGSSCQLVGLKKTLVFYRGRAPKGEKTNWVMHEYRLEGKFAYNLPKSAKDEWVVSRVFHKSNGIKKVPMISVPTLSRINSFADDLLLDYSPNPIPPHNSTSNPTYDNNYPNTGLNPFSVNASTSDYNYQSNLFSTNPIPNLPSHLYPQAAVQHPQHFSFQDQELYSSYNYLNQWIKGLTSSSMPIFINNRSNTIERHHEQLIMMKAEPFSSNHSMVTMSQDTGLSNDMNTTTEITSSAMSSKQEVAGTSSNRSLVEDLLIEGSSAVGSISDLELWEY